MTTTANRDLAAPFQFGDRVRDKTEQQWTGTVVRNFALWPDHQPTWRVRWDATAVATEVREEDLEKID